MSIHATATIISFIGVATLVGVYLFVASRAGVETAFDEVQPRAYRIRKNLFFVLLVGFFLVPALTLRSTPYTADANAPGTTVVDVTAHQWYWTVSRTEVPVGQPVVFRVSSEDVNHGFAVYDEALTIVAQVQAMPGYVNDLAIEFDRPGQYRIMCLEYCGLAHHSMVAVINAVPRIADARTKENG